MNILMDLRYLIHTADLVFYTLHLAILQMQLTYSQQSVNHISYWKVKGALELVLVISVVNSIAFN